MGCVLRHPLEADPRQVADVHQDQDTRDNVPGHEGVRNAPADTWLCERRHTNYEHSMLCSNASTVIHEDIVALACFDTPMPPQQLRVTMSGRPEGIQQRLMPCGVHTLWPHTTGLDSTVYIIGRAHLAHSNVVCLYSRAGVSHLELTRSTYPAVMEWNTTCPGPYI